MYFIFIIKTGECVFMAQIMNNSSLYLSSADSFEEKSMTESEKTTSGFWNGQACSWPLVSTSTCLDGDLFPKLESSEWTVSQCRHSLSSLIWKNLESTGHSWPLKYSLLSCTSSSSVISSFGEVWTSLSHISLKAGVDLPFSFLISALLSDSFDLIKSWGGSSSPLIEPLLVSETLKKSCNFYNKFFPYYIITDYLFTRMYCSHSQGSIWPSRRLWQFLVYLLFLSIASWCQRLESGSSLSRSHVGKRWLSYVFESSCVVHSPSRRPPPCHPRE